MWKDYLREQKSNPQMKRFDLFIKDEIEKKVKTLDNAVMKEGEVAEIEVASISFGYKNRALIKLLQTRGMLLT